MSAMDDYTPDLHRPRNGAKISCAIVVMLIVGTAVLYYISNHSRYQVVGTAEPSSGYEIAYTVSSRYRHIQPVDPAALKSRHELEEWEYVPNAMSAPVRWFYTYILRSADAATLTDDMMNMETGLKPHGIQEVTFVGKAPAGHRIDSQGYVQAGDVAGIGQYVAQDQTTVANCAATWYAFDRSNVKDGERPLRYYTLFLHPKGKQITYMFSGISDSGAEPNDVLDELNEIRDSIVVGVKPSSQTTAAVN